MAFSIEIETVEVSVHEAYQKATLLVKINGSLYRHVRIDYPRPALSTNMGVTVH